MSTTCSHTPMSRKREESQSEESQREDREREDREREDHEIGLREFREIFQTQKFYIPTGTLKFHGTLFVEIPSAFPRVTVFLLKGQMRNGKKFHYELQNDSNLNSPSIRIYDEENGHLVCAYHSDEDTRSRLNVDRTNFGHPRGTRVIYHTSCATKEYALEMKDEIDMMFSKAWWLEAAAFVWQERTKTSATIIERVAKFFEP